MGGSRCVFPPVRVVYKDTCKKLFVHYCKVRGNDDNQDMKKQRNALVVGDVLASGEVIKYAVRVWKDTIGSRYRPGRRREQLQLTLEKNAKQRIVTYDLSGYIFVKDSCG